MPAGVPARLSSKIGAGRSVSKILGYNRQMRILLSNDDGYLAPGLAALHRELTRLGDVAVIAPEQNCSGASNSLTLTRPLSVFEEPSGFRYVNGTPNKKPSVAAATVPEYRVSSPMFWPLLTPETTMSGR